MMSLVLFIDSVSVGDYQKLSQTPVMFTLSCFTREQRRHKRYWRVLGYLDYTNQVQSDNKFTGYEPIAELHEALKVCFAELYYLQKNGFHWNLNSGNAVESYCIKIPIQLIIADVAGADPLCGRSSGHLAHMKGRCRDCYLELQDVDQPYHICDFIKQDEFHQKSKEEREECSFHFIKYPFYTHLSFGASEQGIFGATLTESLHMFDQGICVYISELIVSMLSKKGKQLLSDASSYICSSATTQSERDMPYIGCFRKGFESVSHLKAEERFARCFMLYMVLTSSDFMKYIVHTKPKARTKYTTMHWQCVLEVLEETLAIRQLMKMEQVDRELFISTTDTEPPMQSCIRSYMAKVTQYLPREEGNGWKLYKFHQLLHIVPNILKHGSCLNSDSSTPENLGKEFGKDPARRTRKRTLTLGKESAHRYYEKHLVTKASNLLHATVPQQMIQNDESIFTGSRYILSSVSPYMRWEGNVKSNLATSLFPQTILKAVVAKLFYSEGQEIVSRGEMVKGFTEFKHCILRQVNHGMIGAW